MLKYLSHLALVVAFGFFLNSCKSKKAETLKPGEISEAQKIELRKKAVDNYKKLVEKYPDSPHAEKAQERIQALGGAATPKK
jgi:outer membrane protein assembly factor BamD (BamD/ComL family)